MVTIEINNNANHGHDVRDELVGEKASVATNNVAYTRTEMALAASTSNDADWCGRYHEGYVRQKRDFIWLAETCFFTETETDGWDGYRSAFVAQTGVTALKTGTKQAVQMVAKPEFYK